MKHSSSFIQILLFISIFSPIVSQDIEELDQWLDMSIDKLSSVEVISATKKKQLLSDVPATVRVITAEQIKDRGYISLEDILSDLPGFQFRDINGFNSYSFLRGAPSQNNLILILVDGVQINELNSGGFYGGMHYNLVNAKQIEVVYGPSSALYGTNAISGIINIITNDPGDIKGGTVSAYAGNFDSYGIDFSTGYFSDSNQVGFSLSGMIKQSDKANLGGNEGDNNWSRNMENFERSISTDGKFSYKNLKIGFLFQDKQASRTTNYKSEGTSYLDYGTNWHIRFFNAHLSYLHKFKKKLLLNSRFYYRNATVMDNTIAFIKDDTTNGQVGYYRPNDLFGLEEEFNCNLNDIFSVICGVVVEYERLSKGFSKSYSKDPNIAPPSPNEPDKEVNWLSSEYLQLQARLFKILELTAGIRLDYSTNYEFVYTPRAAAVLNYKKLTGKILYTEAFRAPKPWDYTWKDGNSDLKPEKMRSIEGVVAYRIFKNLSADLSVYRNTIYDKLAKSSSATFWTNSDELNTDGIEFTLNFIKNRIDAYANYTYNRSRDADDLYVDEIAEHTFNHGIAVAITKKIKIGLRGNYVGERRNPQFITSTGSDKVEDYYLLNSSLSLFDFKSVDIQLFVNNILDSKYYHTSNRPPERYRQTQRTFIFKMGYSF